jgi:hypothetical protein
MIKTYSTLILISILALQSLAIEQSRAGTHSDPIPKAKPGAPVFLGSGCPKDSALTTYDQGQLHARLKKFTTQPRAGSSITRLTCSLSVPLQVEKNHQVALRALTLLGHARLSSQSQGQASIELFFAGARGPQVNSALSSARELTLKLEPLEDDLLWSKCNSQPIARVNVAITLKSRSQADEISIESLALKLLTRQCP